jgi:hypothetical protein
MPPNTTVTWGKSALEHRKTDDVRLRLQQGLVHFGDGAIDSRPVQDFDIVALLSERGAHIVETDRYDGNLFFVDTLLEEIGVDQQDFHA